MANKKPKTAPKGKAEQGNVYAIIAYLLGIIGGLIVVLTQKKDKFAIFHAKQSIVLSLIMFIVAIILGFIPIVGWILGATIFPLAVVIVFLWGAYKAYLGEWYRFPIVADYADKLKI